MRINFTTEPKPYWILGRWAEEFAGRIPGATITHLTPDQQADVNVFINYALYSKGPYKSLCVFTHKERDRKLSKRFDIISRDCDWCFAQSDYTMSLLPANKSSKLKIGIGDQFYKKEIVIGISGRPYSSKRKRFEWVKELEKIAGIRIMWTNSRLPYDELADFYKAVDYFLVTSEVEGGPMCIKEAIAMGKPVITTKVGWYNEFPVLTYDNLYELKNIVRKLVVDKSDWDLGAKQIEDKASELLSQFIR
ncbi:MAG: glycosyltransferase [bacterium]|nr:glycosyltransferase [bacterium]